MRNNSFRPYSLPHETSTKMCWIITLLICIAIAPTNTLIGYDCGGEGLNITSLSLTEIGDCDIDTAEPKTIKTYVQLLQRNEYDHVQAIQCRIEIDRQIYYCGMHSHISAVSNGKHKYIQDIHKEACLRIQNTGAFILGNNLLISNIKINTTTSRSVTLAGSNRTDGECTGTTYSDELGTWDKVFVQASVTITMRSFQITIHTPSKEVILPSGTRCPATAENCPDDQGTPTFWTLPPSDRCEFSRYDVLYEGPAHKMTPEIGQDGDLTIYSVSTRGTTFALARTMETNLCGYTITHTEHPKLFILETTKERTFKSITTVNADNLDIFTYVNSKFVYVEKHVKTQLSQLYKDVMSQKCALEKQVLENALSLASIAPDEMAYRLMKATGYTAFVAGEVIYIIKCTPVECRVRQTDVCYQELPVTYKNNSYFMTPRSRILKKTGTIHDCNELLPAMYRIQGTWFRILPKPIESIPPPIIRPLTTPRWKYVSPGNLATSGIYSSDDLERLKNHIMFPVEKPSVINNVAQGIMGGTLPANTISLHNLLDEKSLEKIAESTGIRLWKGFMTFGSASAGILSILMIIHAAKLILNSVIRGYALYSIYGWSIQILGAVWSAVTSVLLYRGHTNAAQNRQHCQEEEQRPEEQLQQVVSQQPSTSAPVKNSETSQELSVSYNTPTEIKGYGELRKYLHDANNHDTVH